MQEMKWKFLTHIHTHTALITQQKGIDVGSF